MTANSATAKPSDATCIPHQTPVPLLSGPNHTTHWSMDTSEPSEDENDLSYIGSESDASVWRCADSGDESTEDGFDNSDREIPKSEAAALFREMNIYLEEMREGGNTRNSLISPPSTLSSTASDEFLLEASRKRFGLALEEAAQTDELPGQKESTERYQDLCEKSQRAVEEVEKEFNNLMSENASLKEKVQKQNEELSTHTKVSQRDCDTKDLYEKSQQTVEVLQKDIAFLRITVKTLETENASLKESTQSPEDTPAAEKQRQQSLQDCRKEYRKRLDTANARLTELSAKESILQESLQSAQDALVNEKVRTRELEIRLEERSAALAISYPKPSEPEETKVEKSLREELEKCRFLVKQQEEKIEKLNDDNVGFRVANTSLEVQLKENKAAKEEALALHKRNADLVAQLRFS
ncbi:hypothetical protein DM02DRAFT_614741 [Periconia macrospinosa]|uniref:Uncharacterized protein n=1 Tax=Periconia macrospinosa TaxID=97972 RepID=A0A2V1DNQ3_9PLEO|nr:hypothetical protein DM02DRAFT_614741 [Periconia macrospinosa]